MTTVDKLMIRGVRSFNPHMDSVIEFFAPLTLIVGANGAGKTTIIEALKYACTGETPPNAGKSGQGFVHDPKVAGEREVKAHVKLRFLTGGGRRFVVARSVSLTQRAGGKLEFKTLDASVVAHGADGARSVQSHRCADIDRFVPEAMGVSKPVLEYVVFCHQEDSNWPLGEGKRVKERFDEIFAATRYTKALEAVRKLRKEHAAEAKTLRLRLETAAAVRDQAVRLARGIEDLDAKARAEEARVREFEAQVAALEERARVLRERRAAVAAEAARVAGMRARGNQLASDVARLAGMLRGGHAAFGGDDDQLAAEIARVQRELRGADADAEALVKRQRELEEARRQAQQRAQQLARDIAGVQAEMQHLNNLRAVRAKSFRAFSTRYKIGASLPLSAADSSVSTQVDSQQQQLATSAEDADAAASATLARAGEMLAELDSRIKEARADAAAVSAECDAAVAELKRELDLLHERMSQRQSERDVAARKLQAARAELAEKQREREKLGSIVDALQQGQTELEEMRRNEATRSAEIVAEMTSTAEAKGLVDSELSELSEAMKHLGMQADARAKLDLAREAVARLQQTLDRELLSEDGQALAEELGGAPETWKDVALRARSERQKAAQLASETRDRAQRRASELFGRLALAKEAVGKCNASISQRISELEVEGLSESEDLDALVRENEVLLERARRDVAMNASAESLYKRFIAIAEKGHVCPLCDRGFPEVSELIAFVEKLRATTEALPDATAAEKKKANLEAAERNAARLGRLREVWDSVRRLRSQELPALQSAVDAAKADHSSAITDVEELSQEALAATAAAAKAEALFRAASSISGRRIELQAAQEAEKAAQERLALESSDTRSLSDVRDLYAAAQAKSIAFAKKGDLLREELSRVAKELSEKERQVQTLREKAASASALDADVARIHTVLGELESAVASSSKELEGLRARMPDADASLRAARQRALEERGNAVALEEQLRRDRDAFHESLLRAQSEHDGIIRKAREVAPKIARLEELERVRLEAEKKADAASRELNEAMKRAEGAKDASAQRELRLKVLNDNKHMRELEAEREEIEEQLRQLGEAAGGSSDSINSELAVAEEKLKKVREYKDTARGQLVEIERQSNKARADLAQPAMAGAAEGYRTALIALQTTELAQSDLDRYYHALDTALMRYHAAKMEDINRLIREMWQTTYGSSDIDAIEIRTDVEEDKTKTTTQRNYHYRVVMLKGQTELDMRGRCSAGQKVLASLVIRLALAESFCLNCGILALDEPTTNLDRKNVKGFAEALTSLLSSRKDQRGFQLLVITHDEEFVRQLSGGDFADYFYRVTKDGRQYSLIQKEDIRSLH